MIEGLQKISRLIQKDSSIREFARSEILTEISFRGQRYKIESFSIGSTAPQDPVLFITGGIHGLERIGAQLAWSLLKTTMDRLLWDESLRELFRQVRLVVVPLVNPIGYVHAMRANGNGVDLMRNSPVNATERTPYLLGGHRISPRLPWFRGDPNVMELENQVLIDKFGREAGQSRSVIAVDFHSGFGMRDRLWFPHAYTSKPFEDLAHLHALVRLFEDSHPYHIYLVEPQSKGYLINGDIWDHIYQKYKQKNQGGIFFPLTLEMGSWTWVRKNPLQIFSRHGAFNPIKEHRVKRTYRRHHLLFDFFLRALYSNQVWSSLDPLFAAKHRELGLERWYGK